MVNFWETKLEFKNKCIECEKPTNNPRYCSSKCSARRNNRLRPKRRPTGKCKDCSQPIIVSKTYCNTCRPKHNTTHRNSKDTNTCLICGIEKNKENTQANKSAKNGLNTYCRVCTSGLSRIQARFSKQERVNYKGGECQHCGYNKCLAALQFHHIEPDDKTFGIAALNTTSNNPRIFEELDKCILLCSNCHHELHANIEDIDDKVTEYANHLYKIKTKSI